MTPSPPNDPATFATMSPAERKLWNALSNRKLAGVRFNRQVVIKPYICDLVARSQKLVIELDGGQHGDAVAYDATRTRFLEARGYRVLRFWNNDVMRNLDGVVRNIEEALHLPPPAGAGGVDSPQASGGGPVASDDDMPSPSSLRSSSQFERRSVSQTDPKALELAPAGGVK